MASCSPKRLQHSKGKTPRAMCSYSSSPEWLRSTETPTPQKSIFLCGSRPHWAPMRRSLDVLSSSVSERGRSLRMDAPSSSRTTSDVPLPLIAIALIGTSVASGGGAGALGLRRRQTAKEIDAAARRSFSNAKRKYTRSRRGAEQAALALGERKIAVMSGPMTGLHNALTLFRQLDFDANVPHDSLPELPLNVHQFEEIDFAEWRRI